MGEDFLEKNLQWPIDPKTGMPAEHASRRIIEEWSVLHERIERVRDSIKKLLERRRFLENFANDLLEEADQFTSNVSLDRLIEMVQKISSEAKEIDSELKKLELEFNNLLVTDIKQLDSLILYNPGKPDA